MLRVSKLTDYATALMTLLAESPDRIRNAQEMAEHAHLETPTASKLLKQLAHAGLVESFRGVNGGYRLARDPALISIANIVTAMEGPIGMTECSAQSGICEHEAHCGVRVNWQYINRAIARALASVTLADMLEPMPPRKPGATIPLRVASI